MASAVDVGLAPLILPDQSLHCLDVVFIHGLNGQRARSWTNSSSELWPLWFIDDLPGARAWTYGYDAGIAVSSRDGMNLHSVRFLSALVEKGIGKSTRPDNPNSVIPIVFVAHSLGGILTKSSICQAQARGQSYSYIFEVTAGVVFLGTPHRGSQWANRLLVAQFGLSFILSPSDFVKILRAKSSELATITERFNNVWGSKPVLSCFETRRTLGVGKIVRQEDAITNCKGEKVLAIHADHHEICKPHSRDTLLYRSILEFLLNCKSERVQLLDETIAPDMGTGNVVKLTKEQKRQRNTVRRILWDQIRGPPTHGLDKWAVIREDWNCDDDTEKCRNWLGGAYMCKFPPGVGDTILQIEVDIQEEIFPVVWMIQTSADAPYYPGRHAGRLEFPPKFPMEQLFIIWDTPIFSPFVRFCSGVGQVSSPFDLGKWSPFYTVQHVLQTIANFLVYDPLCRTKLPMSHGTLEIPFEYSVLEERINRFAADKDKFFHATQFFSRVYNRVGKEVDNPVMLESQKQASITVIRELVSSFCNKRPPVPDGRQDIDYVTSFNLVKGNNEWILEERIWADALFLACEFQFVVT